MLYQPCSNRILLKANLRLNLFLNTIVEKIDAKKLTKVALTTFGTVAVTSLVSRSINSGIDYAIKAGIKAVNNVNWAEVVWKMEAAKKGLIYI